MTSRSASSGSAGKSKAKTAAAELPENLLPAFEALRAWRAEQAREQGVPAYVIFHDATLREIVTVWPSTVGELGGVSGVGEKKLATYGEGVIGVLAGLTGSATPGTAASELSDGPSDDPGEWPEEPDMEPEPDDWA